MSHPIDPRYLGAGKRVADELMEAAFGRNTLKRWTSIPPIPAEQPAGGCDWGGCDNPATIWRWSEGQGWLPVCHQCEEKS